MSTTPAKVSANVYEYPVRRGGFAAKLHATTKFLPRLGTAKPDSSETLPLVGGET